MKLIVFGFLISLFSLTAFAQKITISKSTATVSHSAYQSIYENDYQNLNEYLHETLAPLGCEFKLSLTSLRKETLFKKGQFIGSFKATCYRNIKDINLFFEVYPFDEFSESHIELTSWDGKVSHISTCWRHSGKVFSCDLKVRDFNFK